VDSLDTAPTSQDTLVEPRSRELLFGRYSLRERLGAGGFGVVWSAEDEQLQREVAVKRVWLQLEGPRSQAEPAQAEHALAERAEREAQATARLSHPAIVALYEARAEGEAFYLISELVHGDTLSALLHAEELCDEEVLAIGVALAGALEHAHARGVIHRDVKPQNILVPEDPVERGVAVAKLTDFGGARLAGEDALTRTGDVLGTLAYMAPEQSQGREADERSDLYSLALVLYEALSGINPVRGANPADTARRLGRVLPSLARYRRDLPRALTEAIDRPLAPAPNRRGGLVELREALEEGSVRPARGPHSSLRLRASHPSLRLRARVPVVRPDDRTAAAPDNRARAAALDNRARVATLGDGAPAAAPHDRVPVAAGEPAVRAPRGEAHIPRALWFALTMAVVIWQSVAGRPGVALLAFAALAPLLSIGRIPLSAPAAALAAGLGTLGLAGLFPALAGQPASWRARVVGGALGYWWLLLAEPLLARRLWLGPPTQVPARAVWEGSLMSCAEHVLLPLLGTALLLGVALWALAALALPWLVRGRNAMLDVVAATVWAAALLTAAPLLDHGLPLAPGQGQPRGALLAGILAGALAVGARALRGPV
jgi:eukaryotic-like serine/threonine-protein kinase